MATPRGAKRQESHRGAISEVSELREGGREGGEKGKGGAIEILVRACFGSTVRRPSLPPSPPPSPSYHHHCHPQKGRGPYEIKG